MYYLLQKWLNYELAKIKIVELLTLSYVIVVNLIIIIIIIITIKFKKNWRGGGGNYINWTIYHRIHNAQNFVIVRWQYISYTIYIVRCTIYVVYIVRCTICIVWYPTHCRIHNTLNFVIELYIIRCTIPILYIIGCTIYIVRCTSYDVLLLNYI